MAASHHIPSEHDLELLSAYLDGELTDHERTVLEHRLAQDQVLRAALQGLRETVALVRDLPRLKAPRSFALDPAIYARQKPWWQRWLDPGMVLQLSGALGTAVSVFLIAVLLLNSQGNRSQSESQQLKSETGPTSAAATVEAAFLPTMTLPAALSASATLASTTTPAFDESDMADAASMPQESAATAPDSFSTAGQAFQAAASPAPAEPLIAEAPLVGAEAEGFAPPPAAGAIGLPTATLRQAPAANTADSALGMAEENTAAMPQAAAPAPAPGAGEGAASGGMNASEEQPQPTVSGAGPDSEGRDIATTPPTPSLTPAEVAQSSAETGVQQPGAEKQGHTEETETRRVWWPAGFVLILLALSAGVFIAGRKMRAR